MRFPDLSLAFRNIFRRPGFAAVAITLLALGAGANAAVFSVVRGVLLRPLPFPEPDRLVAVGPTTSSPMRSSTTGASERAASSRSRRMSPGWMMGLVADGGEPIKVTGGRVSDNMFKALGASRGAGPHHRARRRAVPARHGSRCCPMRCGAGDSTATRRSSAAASNSIGQPHTIVGVMPAGFEIFGPGTDLWAALPWDAGQPQSQGDVLAGAGAARAGRHAGGGDA